MKSVFTHPIAEIAKIMDGPEKEITIFIHGYNSVTTYKKFRAFANQIISSQPRGKVYILNWDSGNPLKTVLIKTGLSSLTGGITRKILLNIFKINPYVFFGSIIGNAINDTFKDYKENEIKAIELGSHLQSKYISNINDIDKLPINIIAHSLGSVVVYNALINSNWSKYKLNNIVFLGGAAKIEVEKFYWQKCLSEIDGKIYNIYSEKDNVLKLIKDKRIGQQPIGIKNKRLEDRAYNSYGHTDYWKKLKTVLKDLNLNSK